MALQITDDSFKELLASGKPFAVDFWAEWCGPCRTLGPIVEELAIKYDGKITVGKMDVDANPDTCSDFGIMSIPTVLFFKDGQLIDKNVGLTSKNVLEGKLEKLLD